MKKMQKSQKKTWKTVQELQPEKCLASMKHALNAKSEYFKGRWMHCKVLQVLLFTVSFIRGSSSFGI